MILTLGTDFTIQADETIDYSLFSLTGSGTLSGAFTNVILPDSWNDLALNWDQSNLAGQGLLSVTAQAIPEPSAVIAILGGGALLWFARGKRTVASRRSARKL